MENRKKSKNLSHLMLTFSVLCNFNKKTLNFFKKVVYLKSRAFSV